MKAKKIVEKIFKVLNIIINIIMGIGSMMNFMHYATIDAYVRGDDEARLLMMLFMFILVNGADYFIRKRIREF